MTTTVVWADDALTVVSEQDLERYWVVEGSELEYIELSGRRASGYGCATMPFILEGDGTVTPLSKPLQWQHSGRQPYGGLSEEVFSQHVAQTLPKFRPAAENIATQPIFTARSVVFLDRRLKPRLGDHTFGQLVQHLRALCRPDDLEALYETAGGAILRVRLPDEVSDLLGQSTQ